MERGKYHFKKKGSKDLADAICEGARPGHKAGNDFIDKEYEQNLQENLNDLFKKIREFNNNISSKIKPLILIINLEIEKVIKEKSIDRNKIEHNLDDLLNYMQFNLGEKEFLRLLKYYRSVNKSGYNFYLNEYHNLKEEK